MDKYVIIYDGKVGKVDNYTYVTNQTYYADDMEEVIAWLQDHPEAMVCCVAKLLK